MVLGLTHDSPRSQTPTGSKKPNMSQRKEEGHRRLERMHLPSWMGSRPARRQGSEEEGEEETSGPQPQGPSPISRGKPGLLVYLWRCSHTLVASGLHWKKGLAQHVSWPPCLLGQPRFPADRAALFSPRCCILPSPKIRITASTNDVLSHHLRTAFCLSY